MTQALRTQPGEVQLEQARAILLTGDLQHACDAAAEVLGMNASQEVRFAAHALCGLLWHTLWAASLQPGPSGAEMGAAQPLWYKTGLSARNIAQRTACQFKFHSACQGDPWQARSAPSRG